MKHSRNDSQPAGNDQTQQSAADLSNQQTRLVLTALHDPAQRMRDRAPYMGTVTGAPAASPNQNTAPELTDFNDEEERTRNRASYLGSSSS